MGPKITAAQDFAVELKDYVSMNALQGKEFKSLAKSIGYPLGLFKFHNRVMLANELVFLNAFLGTVTLRLCFSEHPEVKQDVVDEIVDIFTKQLLSQWLPDSMFPDYKQRLGTWGNLFKEFEDGDQYQKDMSQLVTTFYQCLTKSPCDEMKEAMLTLRFNGYMKLFIGSINVMIQECGL